MTGPIDTAQRQQRQQQVGKVVSAEQEVRHRRAAQPTGKIAGAETGGMHDRIAPVVGLTLEADRVSFDGGGARRLHGKVGERGHPLGVRGGGRQPVAASIQLLQRIGTHRLQHPVAHTMRRRLR